MGHGKDLQGESVDTVGLTHTLGERACKVREAQRKLGITERWRRTVLASQLSGELALSGATAGATR